jgi:glutamate racemase
MSVSNSHISKSFGGPIGVFDSGYGGLTILRSLREQLPQYDYLYLGDNARAPYGTRSFDIVYDFTLQAVKYLFAQGCPLIILACNTASAKALRTIQQRWLPFSDDPTRRVLGVIRPTAEHIIDATHNGHVGVFATPGTIASQSYDIEIAKINPDFHTTGHACPMWVPLVENGESENPGADYFVNKDVKALLDADNQIDTIVLGCTHYPLLYDKIRAAVPTDIQLLKQGDIVARSLKDYLHRHPEMDERLTRNATAGFLTTENPDRFADLATLFLGHEISAQHVAL